MSPSRQYSSHPDPMDLWLEAQGYHRKLTARDASCLFRAVSEQIYNSQKYHHEVRKLCVEFMRKHLDVFDGHQVIEGGIENYLEHLLSPNQRGGICEIKAISHLFKVDVLVFKEVGKSAEKVLETSFTKQVMLCSSRDGHYDSVYSSRYTKIAGFLQSLLYGILYKNVFSMKDADFAVEKMLHHKPMRHRGDLGTGGHRKFSSYSCNSIQLQKKGGVLETVFEDEDVNIRELIMKGITPFPYKVAKSLDPNIFRNVEFDVWIDHRRGLKQGYFGLNSELGVGAKCLVQINNETSIAHIQEMSPNKGPVVVFVEELGEKRTVPFETLELLPQETLVSKQNVSKHLIYRQSPQLTENKSSLLTPLEGRLSDKVSRTQSDCDSKSKSNMCGAYENTDNSAMVANISMESFNVRGEYHHPYQCEPSIEMNMNLPIQAHFLLSPQPHGNSQILIPVSPRPEDVPAHWLTTNGVAVQDSSDIDVSTTANLDPSTGQIQDTLKAVPSQDMMDNNGNYLSNVNFQGQQINFNAPKSFLEDGTDLPMSDVQTLRFFYNLGKDVYHSQYGMYSWSGYTQTCTSTSPSTPNPPGICSAKCVCGPVCISTVPTIHHLLEPSTPPSSAEEGLDGVPVIAIQQSETKSSQSTPQTSPSTPLASVPSRFKTKGKNKKDAKVYEGQPLIQPTLQIPSTDDSTNIESQNDGPAAGSIGGHSSPTLSVPFSQSYGYVYYPTSPVVPYSPVESEPFFTPLRLQFPTEYIPDTPQSPQCYSVNGELNIYNSPSQYPMIATSPHYLLPASPGIYVGSPPAWNALTPTTPQ